MRDYFERPEVIEQTKPLQAIVERVFDCCLVVGAALKRVADSPPSSGYEPWLLEHSSNRVAARGLAHLVVRHGNRRANDRARASSAVSALRFLAAPRRNKPARHRKIIILLNALEETSIFETIFADAGLDEFEFARSLKSAAQGNEDAYRRITEFAVHLITPHLSISPGPKLSAASAAHEYFLKNIVSWLKPSHYTWNYSENDFTDPATRATRHEFNDPDFHPQSADRRFKTHKQANWRRASH